MGHNNFQEAMLILIVRVDMGHINLSKSSVSVMIYPCATFDVR